MYLNVNCNMTTEVFNNIVQERIDKITSSLQSKGVEYVRNGDKLHNFNVAAKMLNTTPQDALRGFLVKYLVSIFDIIDDNKQGKDVSIAQIDEKIGDAINYLILLEATFKNKIK